MVDFSPSPFPMQRLHWRAVGLVQAGRGSALDLMMAVLALLVLPIDLPMAQPVRMPVAALLLVYVVWRWRDSLPTLFAGKWALLIPAVCILSALWAADAIAALRHGTLMAVTMVIAAALAARLDVRQIAVVVLISQAILAVASLMTMTTVWVGGMDGGNALIGVFPHKNVAGTRMVYMVFAALVVVCSQGFSTIARMIAVAAIPMAIIIVAGSYSATAKILLIGGVPLAVFFALIWQGARMIKGGRLAISLATLAGFCIFSLAAVNTVASDPVSEFFDAFGKDRSLTGRTEIWLTAQHTIDENPLIGVGAGNFWREDNGKAVHMAERFYALSVDSFSFHSLPVEILVHVGWFGLVLCGWVFIYAGWTIFSGWYRGQTGPNTLYIVFLAAIVLRFGVESELFRVLTFASIIFWLLFFSVFSAKLQTQDRATVPSSI